MATPVIMVKDNSAEVIAKIGKMTSDTLEKFAQTSVAEIKAHGNNIFVEPTGNHAGLIKQEAIGDGKLTRKISSSSGYGAFLEYGTSKMKNSDWKLESKNCGNLLEIVISHTLVEASCFHEGHHESRVCSQEKGT